MCTLGMFIRMLGGLKLSGHECIPLFHCDISHGPLTLHKQTWITSWAWKQKQIETDNRTKKIHAVADTGQGATSCALDQNLHLNRGISWCAHNPRRRKWSSVCASKMSQLQRCSYWGVWKGISVLEFWESHDNRNTSSQYYQYMMAIPQHSTLLGLRNWYAFPFENMSA
jgi:hypothetical protein